MNNSIRVFVRSNQVILIQATCSFCHLTNHHRGPLYNLSLIFWTNAQFKSPFPDSSVECTDYLRGAFKVPQRPKWSLSICRPRCFICSKQMYYKMKLSRVILIILLVHTENIDWLSSVSSWNTSCCKVGFSRTLYLARSSSIRCCDLSSSLLA